MTLRIVAEHAQIWHSFTRVDDIARKLGILDEWCSRVGRDPAEIERSAGISVDRLDLADRYYAAGIRQVTLGFSGPDYDLSDVPKWLEWRDAKNAG